MALYRVVVYENDTPKVELDSLGEFYTESVALREAEKESRKMGLNCSVIVWRDGRPFKGYRRARPLTGAQLALFT